MPLKLRFSSESSATGDSKSTATGDGDGCSGDFVLYTTQHLACNSQIFEGISGSIYSYSTEDSLISLIEINLRLILIDEFS